MKKNLLFGAALASLVLVNVANVSAETAPATTTAATDSTGVVERIKASGSSFVSHVRSNPIKYGVGLAAFACVCVAIKLFIAQDESAHDDMTNVGARK